MKYLLLLSLFAVGCATTDKYESILREWIGEPESKLVESWGPPDSTYTTTEGFKILTWNRGANGVKPSYNAMTNKYENVGVALNCKTSATIEAGKVKEWDYSGTSCRAR